MRNNKPTATGSDGAHQGQGPHDQHGGEVEGAEEQAPAKVPEEARQRPRPKGMGTAEAHQEQPVVDEEGEELDAVALALCLHCLGWRLCGNGRR
jgi:hypothetical protein